MTFTTEIRMFVRDHNGKLYCEWTKDHEAPTLQAAKAWGTSWLRKNPSLTEGCAVSVTTSNSYHRITIAEQ